MDSGEEDDAFTMGEREWQRMKRNLSKQGYRDGKNDGREKGVQQSFEVTAKSALAHCLRLGQLVGMIEYKIALSTVDQFMTEKLRHVYETLVNEKERCKRESIQDMEIVVESWERRLQIILDDLSNIDGC